MTSFPIFAKVENGNATGISASGLSVVGEAGADATVDTVAAHAFGDEAGRCSGRDAVRPTDHDLTAQHAGAPLGETDCSERDGCSMKAGRPVRGALIEVWQANAAGTLRAQDSTSTMRRLIRISRDADETLTDDEGRYKFISIKPGAYPWGNHHNAWRPAHIHFSIFGDGLLSRLVTQMYFPGDPLLPFDPIYNCIADERAKQRLISTFDWENTTPGVCLGISIRYGVARKRRHADGKVEMSEVPTASQTVGPFFSIGLSHLYARESNAGQAGNQSVTVRGRVLDGDGVGVPDAVLEIWQHVDEGIEQREESDSDECLRTRAENSSLRQRSGKRRAMNRVQYMRRTPWC